MTEKYHSNFSLKLGEVPPSVVNQKNLYTIRSAICHFIYMCSNSTVSNVLLSGFAPLMGIYHCLLLLVFIE